MATKTTIQGLINSLIRSNPALIDKSEHADVEDALLNELFPASNNYVLNSGNFHYNLNFSKQGNICYLTGTISETNGNIVGNVKMLDIPNPIYYPKDSAYVNGVVYTSNNNIQVIISSDDLLSVPFANAIFLVTPLGGFDVVYINTTYIVND